MKLLFLATLLIPLGLNAQAIDRRSDLEKLIESDFSKAEEIVFQPDTTQTEKSREIKNQIASISDEVLVFIEDFDEMNDASAQYLSEYQEASLVRLEYITALTRQYEQIYLNVGLSQEDRDYIDSVDMMKKKAIDLIVAAHPLKLIAKERESQPDQDLNQYQKYITVEVPNDSNCKLTAQAIVSGGVIEEYKPGSHIKVSREGYNNNQAFGEITPSEIDSFYKTLKFIFCKP